MAGILFAAFFTMWWLVFKKILKPIAENAKTECRWDIIHYCVTFIIITGALFIMKEFAEGLLA